MGVLHTTADARTCGFEALYRRHFELVWALSGHFGVPSGARDDVAQEVWITIHRRLAAVEPGASTRAWVAAITRNVALHHHRTHARRARKHEALSHVVVDRTMPDAIEDRAAIDDGLAQLDDDQREVFLLVAVEELTGPEVAEILGVSVNTVYSRLRLARARLARMVTSLDDERRLAARLHARPSSAEQQRVWIALGPLLTPTPIVPHATGTSTLGGKLLVAATSAVVTVIATVATGGLGGSAAHATPTIEVADTREVDASVAAPVECAELDAPARAEPPRTMIVREPTTADAGPKKIARVRAPHAARRAPRSAEGPRVPAAPTTDSETTAAPATDTLAAEARLLGEARRAITAGDTKTALALLDRHAREYPDGALSRDREAARSRLVASPRP